MSESVLTISRLAKLTSQDGDKWVPHSYGRTYAIESTRGQNRLRIAAGSGGAHIFLRLSEALRDPFFVLYLLLIPRGSGEDHAGRYQSPPMTRPEMQTLIQRFSRFLDQDARHHIWLRSDKDDATLVYDRHNVIFAYGPLSEYQRLLIAEGYAEAAPVSFPKPHGHNYHSEFDSDERELLAGISWTRSPLQDGDEY